MIAEQRRAEQRPVAASPRRRVTGSPPRPQAMLFTLWGDYIVHRGGEIWVGSLIRIAAEFGLSELALRSVLGRLARAGWLESSRHGNRSYYRLTGRGQALIAEGRSRIFRPRRGAWDGQWHLVSYSVPETQRELRDQFRKRLSYLCFGSLAAGAWITPHDLRGEAAELTSQPGMNGYVDQVRGAHLPTEVGRELAARVWPLARLADDYGLFAARWQEVAAGLRGSSAGADPRAFVLRFRLVHEYQRFFLEDPDLPTELLPPSWPGRDVAGLFETLHNRLAPAANRFFDAVFEAHPRCRGFRAGISSPCGREG